MSENHKKKHGYLSGRSIAPPPITGKETVADLMDKTFYAYNAGRLSEACRLLAEKMLERRRDGRPDDLRRPDPGRARHVRLIPLIEAGFVDWIVSTGANLYHDTHFGLGLPLHQGRPRRRRLRAPRRRRHPHLRHLLRLQTSARHRRLLPRADRGAGVPADDGHGRVPLPGRQVPARARTGARASRRQSARRGLRGGRADLHVVARATARSA